MIKPLTVPTKFLSQSISSSASSFKVNNIKGWALNTLGANINLTAADFGARAYCVFRNDTGSIIEVMEIDPATIASASITILKRGLGFSGDQGTQTTAYKLDWPAGSIVQFGTDVPQLLAEFFNTDFERALYALGSAILFQTVGNKGIDTTFSLADGTIRFAAVYVNRNCTLTGVKFYQSTQGSFTGDNTNGLALYSYSGGTLTKVAETANDENIWKGTANTYQTVAFATPYVASQGIYFVAALYNTSAQTTAPTIGAYAGMTNAAMSGYDFTNSAKLYGTLAAQATLPASQASSGITAGTAPIWFALY